MNNLQITISAVRLGNVFTNFTRTHARWSESREVHLIIAFALYAHDIWRGGHAT